MPAGIERRDVVAVLAVALAVVAVTVLSAELLPARAASADLLAGRPWWEGWVIWDSGWYREIALYGYRYTPGAQGPVAFFPLYPLLMRAGGRLVGSVTGPGIVLTLTAGVGSALLLAGWLRRRLAPDAAWTALLLFLLYPYSFYLFGTVYADAVFLIAVLASFTVLERGHPVLAGLLGAVAAATRPLGIVIVVGLVVRTLELRGVLASPPAADAPGRRERAGGGRLRPGDAGTLLAVTGLAAYMLYLWRRFGDPFAFLSVQEAWGQQAGPHTWLKVDFFKELVRFASPDSVLVLVSHAAVTVVAIALLARVVRRFGWGYGAYTILVVGLPALSTKNFTGMGRYLLAAFPCFAVAGELLASRRGLRAWVLAASGVLLLAMASFAARRYYVS